MFTENRAVFLNQAGHAVAGIYDAAGANVAVSVLFDEAYLSQTDIGGTNPVATGDSAVFPVAAIGKTLTVAGTVYAIRGREPIDDGAFVLLQLQKS